MTFSHIPIAAFLFAAATINAASIVAVLEVTPSGDAVNLSISEYRHLTDELRARARETLPSGYSILTRDNIIQLLPPDDKEAECLAEGCAVDIGRAIGAEYVSQSFVGMFGGMLSLTVELYESMSGNMLGSFVTESDNVHGLLGTIREKASVLFSKIAEKDKGKAGGGTAGSIPANVPAEPKKGVNPFWVAVGLDVLGATAIGLGVWQHSKAAGYHDDYKKSKGSDAVELQKKVEGSATMSNIFYITGGALLAAGMGVHIWF
jgi:hypothetical protein